jgi:hypothetical protein
MILARCPEDRFDRLRSACAATIDAALAATEEGRNDSLSPVALAPPTAAMQREEPVASAGFLAA